MANVVDTSLVLSGSTTPYAQHTSEHCATSAVEPEYRSAFRGEGLRRLAVRLFVLLSIGVFANALNVANPGYYNEDEIRFGTYGQNLEILREPTFSFSYFGHFHYRPLSFRCWMYLSHYIYAYPQLFHVVLVAMGIINGMLVYGLARLCRFSPGLALVAFCAFLLNPAAAMTAGQPSAIADPLCMFFLLACGLMLGVDYRLAESGRARWSSRLLLHLLAVGLFVGGLTAKESVLCLPAALVVIALGLKRWRLLGPAVVWLTCISVLYVLVRWHGMDSIKQGGYHLDPFYKLGERLTCYFCFPFLYDHVALHNICEGRTAWAIGISAMLHLVFLLFLALRRWWAPLVYLLFWAIALLPVLPLSGSATHYMYCCSIPMALGVAYLWAGSWKVQKVYALVVLSLFAAHSLVMQEELFTSGVIQERFFATLHSLLLTPRTTASIDLPPEPPREGYQIQVDVNTHDQLYRVLRFTHAVGNFDGIPVKAVTVTVKEALDPTKVKEGILYLRMLDSGHLVPRVFPVHADARQQVSRACADWQVLPGLQ